MITNSLLDTTFVASLTATAVSKVVLLLHFDGTEGQTTFTDSSHLNHTVTAVGTGRLTTSASKFGGSSLLLDGSGYVELAASSDWTMGTGNWTIEFWINWTTIRNDNGMFTWRKDSNDNNAFGCWFNNPNHKIQMSLNNDGYPMAWTSWTPTLGQWYHLAYVRNGNNVRLFVDGTSWGDVDITGANGAYSTATLKVGAGQPSAYQVIGYMDEVRYTKAAVYSANFTASGPLSP